MTSLTSMKGIKVNETLEVEGHNSKPILEERLRSLVGRIERLASEKKMLSDDISDIYKEAKGAGFDVKVLRRIIVLRKKEESALEEEATLIQLYAKALGMQLELPL